MTEDRERKRTGEGPEEARIALRRAEAGEDARLRGLYETAFPPEERAPYRLLKRRARGGRADFWSLYDGDEWAGFAYVLPYADLAYLFFFAVAPEKRGRGAGSGAIRALREKYMGRRLFVAVEEPDPEAANAAQRERRHAFYARCGMRDLPYRVWEVGAEFMTMGFGGPVEPEEYNAMTDAWLGWPARLFLRMRMFDEPEEKGENDG